MAKDRDHIHKYILSPMYALRGWNLLPYAVQARFVPHTEFLEKEPFELMKKCDGKTELRMNELSEEQHQLLERWLRGGFIHEAAPGDTLLPIQEYQFFPVRFKEEVQWSITGRCNYRCRHCFMSAPHAAQGEPSWQELMHMLDSFERCGIHAVNLTGGEPMVRKDFWQLVDEILSRQMIIPTLYSNGALITDEFLDQLDLRGMRPVIQFSFDGVGSHDWMRGVPGAERAVNEAMKRCRERGFRFSASMVVFRENLGSIRETVNHLAALGCEGLKIGRATPQGEWLNEKEHYLSNAELYQAFLGYIPEYFEDGTPMSIDLSGMFNYVKDDETRRGSFFEKDIPEELFHKRLMCGHVRRGMYVSPQGFVLPCMNMVGSPIEHLFPNLLETRLERILNGKSLYMEIINYRISDYMEHQPDCQKCRYRQLCCGGCRAIALETTPTDYLGKDMSVCEYYLGGWMEKKDALMKELRKKYMQA